MDDCFEISIPEGSNAHRLACIGIRLAMSRHISIQKKHLEDQGCKSHLTTLGLFGGLRAPFPSDLRHRSGTLDTKPQEGLSDLLGVLACSQIRSDIICV